MSPSGLPGSRHKGHQVVVVLSAMSGETNKLIALAKEIQANPDPRELDMMMSTGEQVTIGLLAMALKEIGCKAKSYTGGQVKVLTDSTFTKARILSDRRSQHAPRSRCRQCGRRRRLPGR
jgi:aspartate kinase